MKSNVAWALLPERAQGTDRRSGRSAQPTVGFAGHDKMSGTGLAPKVSADLLSLGSTLQSVTTDIVLAYKADQVIRQITMKSNVAWALLPERAQGTDRRSGRSAQPTVGFAGHDKVSGTGLAPKVSADLHSLGSTLQSVTTDIVLAYKANHVIGQITMKSNVAWALLPERAQGTDRRSGRSAQPTVGFAGHDKVSGTGLASKVSADLLSLGSTLQSVTTDIVLAYKADHVIGQITMKSNVAWALLPERAQGTDRRSGRSAQPTIGFAGHDKVSGTGLAHSFMPIYIHSAQPYSP